MQPMTGPRPDPAPPSDADASDASAFPPVADVVIDHKSAVDEMQARGVRVALIEYADALRKALDAGVSVRMLVVNGIPLTDIRKATEARDRASGGAS